MFLSIRTSALSCDQAISFHQLPTTRHLSSPGHAVEVVERALGEGQVLVRHSSVVWLVPGLSSQSDPGLVHLAQLEGLRPAGLPLLP